MEETAPESKGHRKTVGLLTFGEAYRRPMLVFLIVVLSSMPGFQSTQT